MDQSCEVFLSLNGEIIIKNNDSLLIYCIKDDMIQQAFSNDTELHQMILMPLKKIPTFVFKKHREKIIKFFNN